MSCYKISTNVPSLPSGSTATPTTLSIPTVSRKQYAPEQTDPGFYIMKNVGQQVGMPILTTTKYRVLPSLYGKKSPIAKVRQWPGKQGFELHVNLKETWTMSLDTEDETANCTAPSYDIPVSGSITVHMPYVNVLTEDDVKGFITRMLSPLFNVDGSSNLYSLMLGAIDLRN